MGAVDCRHKRVERSIDGGLVSVILGAIWKHPSIGALRFARALSHEEEAFPVRSSDTCEYTILYTCAARDNTVTLHFRQNAVRLSRWILVKY